MIRIYKIIALFRIIRFANQGFNQEKIAEELDCSQGLVSQGLKVYKSEELSGIKTRQTTYLFI